MSEDRKISVAVYVAHGGVIAALYVVFTLIANAFGMADQAIQVRISEALTVLPALTPAAIPGLFVGCIVSNTIIGAVLPDIIFGSLATLVAAIITRALRNKSRFLLPIPPILANTIVVPLSLDTHTVWRARLSIWRLLSLSENSSPAGSWDCCFFLFSKKSSNDSGVKGSYGICILHP